MLPIIIICIFVFLAGFVDSIAGGGGLISLPAYFFIGLPAHNAIATNKFSAACGTTFSAVTFYKHKALDLKIAVISAITSFIASYAGSSVALLINEKALHLIFIIILPVVALFLMTKKDLGTTGINKLETPTVKQIVLCLLIGFCIGFYDGLIGPGTGTFAIIAFTSILGYDLITASGNAKILNLASNYASVIRFWIDGKILFHIAIPAALLGIAGNYLGSKLAIRKGAPVIKIIMIGVLVLLFGKMLFEFLGKK